MDLKGSLVDTCIKIYPSKILCTYLKTISEDRDIPNNILKIVKGNNYLRANNDKQQEVIKPIDIELNDSDIQKLNKIKESLENLKYEISVKEIDENSDKSKDGKNPNDIKDSKRKKTKSKVNNKNDLKEIEEMPYLTTSDIDWLYLHLQKRRINGDKDVPFLHILLEGIQIEMPENRTLKRNPVLEARCVKLRAQQEAREYRKMTKTVDNVRMRFPEDTISYQLKQVNRQLIAIGQFIISIFAGFLFGFRGVEWMVGNLDFGFRLLLGVMCALIIALAEIYFLAKKLNEELNIPETIQLGGPPKFADETLNPSKAINMERSIKSDSLNKKEHAD